MTGKKFKHAQKAERNKRLVEFHFKNPTWTLEAIGKLFKISTARVSEILKIQEQKNGHNEPTL